MWSFHHGPMPFEKKEETEYYDEENSFKNSMLALYIIILCDVELAREESHSLSGSGVIL